MYFAGTQDVQNGMEAMFDADYLAAGAVVMGLNAP
jgi:hypothetical protein